MKQSISKNKIWYYLDLVVGKQVFSRMEKIMGKINRPEEIGFFQVEDKEETVIL